MNKKRTGSEREPVRDLNRGGCSLYRIMQKVVKPLWTFAMRGKEFWRYREVSDRQKNGMEYSFFARTAVNRKCECLA